ncbi:MAG: hypothetical protein U0W24_04380 [Bacteroidales bacterium]
MSVSQITEFEKAIAELTEIILKIEALQALQEKDLTGITADTRQLIDQLIELMADISGALQSLAYELGNMEMAGKVNFTESALSSMRKQDIISACTILIAEVVKTNPESLAVRGISAGDVTELQRLYDKVKLNLQAPQMAIIDQSSSTDSLRKLFEQASSIKKNTLDMLVRQYKRKDPDFHQRYLTASKVIYKRANRKNNGDEVVNEATKVQEK